MNDPQNARVLIVDDTLQNIQVLGTVLREQNYQLNVAQNGLQALEMVQKVKPNLILLDVMMPELDGHETCKRLKADPETQDIPIIFLTAKVETDDIVKGFELGAIDYVTKPFNATELLRRVETHLELSLLRKDLERQVEEKTSQLLQAQKLESMGQLAAGIAHEVNTPMQFIGNNTDFLKQVFEDLGELMEKSLKICAQAKDGRVDDELLEEMDEALEDADVEYLTGEAGKAIGKIQDGVSRVVDIVKGMRELAHPGGREKTRADLNQTIQNSISVCRNEWKYVADLELNLDDGLPLVECFPSEVSQCVINLVVNAAHAVGDATGQGSEGKGTIIVSTQTDGDWMEIRVADTGTGIPEEAQPHIFEFLYTTKEVGKGTGQGLSLVHRVVVDNHGGEISFETAPGTGTTFLLRLPVKSQEQTGQQA